MWRSTSSWIVGQVVARLNYSTGVVPKTNPLKPTHSSPGRTHRSKVFSVDPNWKGKVIAGGARSADGVPTETLSVHFYGTSSSGYAFHRWFTSIGLKLCFHNTPAYLLLFDAGEGTCRRLFECGTAPCNLDYIFITHLHADHILGLPSLVISAADRSKPLHIYGPEGIRYFLRSALLSTRVRVPVPIHTHELILPEQTKRNQPFRQPLPPYRTEVEDTDIYPDDKESSKIHFSEEKFQELGVPRGSVRRRLTQVISGVRPGRKVTISVDTSDSSSLASLAEQSSLLIHDATNLEDCLEESIQSGHSTAKMAGVFARQVNAEFLALTHISPRIWSSDTEQQMIREAMAGFAKRGRCIIAEDMCRIDLEEREMMENVAQSAESFHS
ncbi:Ribonuclease Z [Galdieria sulphuraria]|nr:Ribonuclease Z [Galdieria sulphuraria]